MGDGVVVVGREGKWGRVVMREGDGGRLSG